MLIRAQNDTSYTEYNVLHHISIWSINILIDKGIKNRRGCEWTKQYVFRNSSPLLSDVDLTHCTQSVPFVSFRSVYSFCQAKVAHWRTGATKLSIIMYFTTLLLQVCSIVKCKTSHGAHSLTSLKINAETSKRKARRRKNEKKKNIPHTRIHHIYMTWRGRGRGRGRWGTSWKERQQILLLFTSFMADANRLFSMMIMLCMGKSALWAIWGLFSTRLI